MTVIGNKEELVRFSYAHVWEPKAMNEGDPLKYSVQILIPKTHKATLKTVNDAIDQAIKKGIADGKITAALTKNPSFRICLRDGDLEAAGVGDSSKDHLKGYFFFNASSKEDRQPTMLDKYGQVIMKADDFYSGCYGIADVGFFAYKNKGMGVAAGLNHLMKREDGERLDGLSSAETAFAAFKDELEGSSDLQ